MMSDRITTSFGAQSTAAGVIAGIDLSGQRAIVTGGSSGIGVETARALAAGPASRWPSATPAPATGPRPASRPAPGTARCTPRPRPGRPGLSRRFHRGLERAAEPAYQQRRRHGAAQPAAHPGGLGDAVRYQPPGSFRPGAGPARRAGRRGEAPIVSLSSRGHLRSPVIFDDLNFASRRYDPWLAYGQSKTANILFAVEANRRWGESRASPPTPSTRAPLTPTSPGTWTRTNSPRCWPRAPSFIRCWRRARRRVSWWQRRPSSRGSAATISRTATRPGAGPRRPGDQPARRGCLRGRPRGGGPAVAAVVRHDRELAAPVSCTG